MLRIMGFLRCDGTTTEGGLIPQTALLGALAPLGRALALPGAFILARDVRPVGRQGALPPDAAGRNADRVEFLLIHVVPSHRLLGANDADGGAAMAAPAADTGPRAGAVGALRWS